MGANEVRVVDSVMTPVEQRILLDWAETRWNEGRLLQNPRDPDVFCTPYRSAADRDVTPLVKARDPSLVWAPRVDDGVDDPLPGEFWAVRSRVIERLALLDVADDPYKGSFLVYVRPGASVHTHRDERLLIDSKQWLLFRCNVLFARPQRGGLPVIVGTEIDVPDRGLWAFYPSELVHGASTVEGASARGILSYGFIVDPATMWARRFHVSPQFDRQWLRSLGDRGRGLLVQRLRSQGWGDWGVELFEAVLAHSGDFSVAELAAAVGQEPGTIVEAVTGLQRAGVVESLSSTMAGVFVM